MNNYTIETMELKPDNSGYRQIVRSYQTEAEALAVFNRTQAIDFPRLLKPNGKVLRKKGKRL